MGFSAEPAEIKSFSESMKVKHDDINAMILRADGLAQDVNNPAFQGAAGTAFQQSMTSYLNAARSMNQKLFESSDNVATVANTISETEIGVAQEIIASHELDLS
ncbi:WXG100 family type VII secretion target [Nocardia sp. NPDC060259]|uniref:WXG100 family type VII secretion target n=1 Tax=Nocardia sp. NPDC060259 TaxID=3347088 RepID=UPI00364A2F95